MTYNNIQKIAQYPNKSAVNVLVKHYDPTTAPTLGGVLSAVVGSLIYQSDGTNGVAAYTNSTGSTWVKVW